MIETHFVTGGGGTKIHVARTGPEDAPPILFLHGWGVAHLAWRAQLEGPLAENYRLHAWDMRGHGMSDKPTDFAAYGDRALWAADVAAAVDACGAPPVVVTWSYGGAVLGDYLHHHGDNALAGILLAGSVVSIGQKNPPPGPDTPVPMLARDMATAIPALRRIIDLCVPGGMDVDALVEMTACAAMVAPEARRGLLMRKADARPDYARVTKPARIIFGTADALVDIVESEDAMTAMPHARRTLYEGVGHAPFHEEADRFNTELAEFAAECFAAGKAG